MPSPRDPDALPPIAPASLEAIPVAKAKAGFNLPLVWLVPITAFFIAGWLIWSNLLHRGPVISISFETAEGLEAGKTRIKYKDVDVGLVKTVTISQDLRRIEVTAEMVASAQRYLTQKTSFWVVRPRVGSAGVSGLSTLVSGAFIEIDPALDGDATTAFTGLEEPPLIRSEVPGRRLTLRGDNLGSVGRGAPIYYRGIEVGQVLGYTLEEDRRHLQVPIFVREPYDDLVRTTTRFWNASGVTLSTGADGFRVDFASLQALAVGGIEFDTPPGTGRAELASSDTPFLLFPSRQAADEASFSTRNIYVAEFEGSTRGLRPRAPVEIRGLRIGTVSDVGLVYDPDGDRLKVRAMLEIDPARLRATNANTGEVMPQQDPAALVERGLRAQLKPGNLLTGDLFVDLDFHADAPRAELRRVGEYELIPSVPTQLDRLSASVSGILEKAASLPLDELMGDLRATFANLRQYTGPETAAAIGQLGSAFASMEKVAGSAEQQLPATLAALRQATQAAELTMRDLRGAVANDSTLRYDLGQALKEMAGAARSIRSFADYLDRHPEALIRGRSGR